MSIGNEIGLFVWVTTNEQLFLPKARRRIRIFLLSGYDYDNLQADEICSVCVAKMVFQVVNSGSKQQLLVPIIKSKSVLLPDNKDTHSFYENECFRLRN